MKRLPETLLSIILLIVLSPLLLLISALVKLSSKGPVLNVSERIGINNAIFRMYKFRTMRIDTPAVATHLLKNPDHYLTSIGGILRKTSLDELPQLYNVLKGDMNFVGPRPALYNQDDLSQLRTSKGIHTLRPGITGWAQVNGRDDLPIPVKVGYDEYYRKHKSFLMDLKIIWMTIVKVIKSEGVQH